MLSLAEPVHVAIAPAAAAKKPSTRRQVWSVLGVANTPRIASTGATRPARRAGSMAARSVTPTPTPKVTSTVTVLSCWPLTGMPDPSDDRSFVSPHDSPKPANSPSPDPNRPTTSASAVTERVTWPRLAPTARSRAISRDRCATTIENVLAMMNEPDDQGDHAERRQEGVDEGQCLLELALALLAQLGPGPRRQAVRQYGGNGLGQLALVHALVRGHQEVLGVLTVREEGLGLVRA